VAQPGPHSLKGGEGDRVAGDRDAINAYWQSLVDGAPIPAPAPNQDCPDSPATGSFFGNTDIFGGSYADPTTPDRSGGEAACWCLPRLPMASTSIPVRAPSLRGTSMWHAEQPLDGPARGSSWRHDDDAAMILGNQ
jgi:hypothetical protein